MSITRKLLKGMGLTEEQQDTILEAHTATLEDIKKERARYKADAAEIDKLELDGEPFFANRNGKNPLQLFIC